MESLLLSALFFFAPQFAAQWSCDAERWSRPAVYEDGFFKGTVSAECRISGAQGGGIAALDRQLLEKVRSSKQIHSGPTSGSHDGLPSVSYDVTADVQDENHAFVVRHHALIATDAKSRLVFFTDSTKVEGKDDEAKHVKKLDGHLEVVKDGEPGVYRIKLGTTIHIKKPWYAPEGAFKSRSEKAAFEAFQSGRDQTLPQLNSVL